MRMRWKLLGLAGIAGVAATGAVAARNRRVHNAYDPDELRDKLHERLAEAAADRNGNAAGAAELSQDVPPPA
jgi:predicted dehydrogenase